MIPNKTTLKAVGFTLLAIAVINRFGPAPVKNALNGQ